MIPARPGVGMTDQEEGHGASLPGSCPPFIPRPPGRVTPGPGARITLAVMAAPTGEAGTGDAGTGGAGPGVGLAGSGRNGAAPLGPFWRTVRELGLALIVAGVIVLLFVGYQLWGTGIAEAHSQAALKRDFAARVAATAGHAGTADTPTVGGAPPSKSPGSSPGLPDGGAVDHLVIPKIHLNVYVVQGVGDDDLRRGPGHYPQTVFPGQDGNAAIAGHRTTYGAPFFSLNELSLGDDIDVTDTSGRTFVYAVSAPPGVVSPDDVTVLDPTSFAQLTLTTCNPRYSDTSRLIVVADLVGGPALPASAAATASPAGVRRREPRPGPERRLGPDRAVRGGGGRVVARHAPPDQPHPALDPRRRGGDRDGAVPGASVVYVRECRPAAAPEHLSRTLTPGAASPPVVAIKASSTATSLG